MRILLVYDHLDTGGTQTYGRSLSRALICAGHAVAVASRGGNTASRFTQAGVSNFVWPAPKRSDVIGLIRGVREAGRLLRSWSPDIIHAHAVLPGLLFSIAARRVDGRRAPIVFGPQRSWRNLYRFPGGQLLSWIMYQMLRSGADEVIAVSEGLRREFVENGISPARCHLIPNGVDMGPFETIATSTTSSSHSGPVVGTVGRLVEQKGMDVFVEAAARISAQAPDARFWIVGDGPLRPALSRQIDALSLSDRVRLMGDRADVASLLAQMTVFVSASRWEGLPYALLEAMAACRPIVATRVLGSSELVEEGVTGLLVPPDDSEAMSRAVISLLNDPDRARWFGLAGRRLAETCYNVETMANRVIALYEQTLSAAPSSA